MALYRCEAKIFSRKKRGRSVVAAAAYRAGARLKDERSGETFDYRRRNVGVVESAVLAPENAPAWALEPESLWNKVEANEKRIDAQLAREFILALPRELSRAQQWELVQDWVQQELVGNGMIVDACLHNPRNGRNPHAHLLCTMRRLDGDKFNRKKATEWNAKPVLADQRKSWADAVNAALEKAGRPERVDHRSLKDQGIDRIPEPKIGVAATAMKRKGLLPLPDKLKQVLEVRMLNELKAMLKDFATLPEIPQIASVGSIWNRSLLFATQVREKAVDFFKDKWKAIVETRQQPPKDPGMSR